MSERQGPVDYIARTAEKYTALGFGTYGWIHSDEPPPFARPSKPLSESRVGLIASGGIYSHGQIAFHYKDDLSYRRIERDTRVVIEVGDVSWQATRDGALWRSVDLDEQATWARLNALAQASIAYRLEPVEMLAEVAARVTIWRGESQKVIEVGPEGEDGFHRARDVDGGEPYRVRAAELTNLGLD